MTEPPVLDLQLSIELVQRVTRFLHSIKEFPATLCLLKGKALGEDTAPRWTYGSYGPDNISAVEPELAQLGHPLLYKVGDLIVAIPQYQLVSELEGKTLALVGGQVALLPRN
jgi:hypothetical protein